MKKFLTASGIVIYTVGFFTTYGYETNRWRAEEYIRYKEKEGAPIVGFLSGVIWPVYWSFVLGGRVGK
jgi:hypothetical protein